MIYTGTRSACSNSSRNNSATPRVIHQRIVITMQRMHGVSRLSGLVITSQVGITSLSNNESSRYEICLDCMSSFDVY